ncbi:TolC family protein [Dysgonomonas mossii]|uniref:TolC family protein n=1 Tax=Dysgonomonas mossii TaxID=163665 RepID=UPI003995ACA0
MKPIIYILLSVLALSAQAQVSFDNVLKEIEMNNTTLKAYREKANADKIGNKTGINMANPEVEFGYLWGNPSGEGNRVDLNVTQSFDFPTAYRYKKQLSDRKNQQVNMIYDQQKVKILQQARLICVELVYQTKMNKRLSDRLKQARELSEAYQKSFDQGNIDVLERNKTKLNLLNAEKALQINEVDLNLSKSELQRLNGGLDITEFNRYSDFTFPLNFIEWFAIVKANNPSLRVAEQEVTLSRKQEQLTRALNLPKITAGYASERVSGTTFQGVSVGVSIPLWEGKNTVKHQKAQTVALQMQHEDSELQFRNTLKNQYDKAKKLSLLLKEYEDALSVTSSQDLLKMALDKGQLSLINYLLELSVYYETVDKYLETERDYQLAVAELQQWER